MTGLGIRFGVVWTVLAAAAVTVALAMIPISAQAATNGDLCLYGTDATADTGIQMQAGTSPAIAALPGSGADVAFQTASGVLATYDATSRSLTTTVYRMDHATSPAIATDGSGVFVAITGSGSDELYTGNGTSMTATGQVVEAGTDPAVAATSSTAADYLFAGTKLGLVEGDGSGWTNQDFGMASGTSPSVATVSGAWEAANQANTNTLWTATAKVHTNLKLGMDATTTPAIAALGTKGDAEAAFQANTNILWVHGSASAKGDTGYTMAPDTDPSITAIGSGTGFEVAYQGADGDLWLDGSAATIDTGLAMASGTSPSIAATSSGYEVAYQCAPPPPPQTTTVAQTTTVVQTTTAPAATVTITTPAPTGSPTRLPKIRARFEMYAVYNGQATHVAYVKSTRRLPRHSTVTFACRAATRTDPCPRLGRLDKHTRHTLAQELGVVANRTFAHDNLLTVTVSARRHATEVFSARLTGRKPKFSPPHWK